MTEKELRTIAREIADNIFNPRDRDGHTLISLLNSTTKRLTSQHEADLLADLIKEENHKILAEERKRFEERLNREKAEAEKERKRFEEWLNREKAEAEKERKRFEADKYVYYYNIFQIGEA